MNRLNETTEGLLEKPRFERSSWMQVSNDVYKLVK